MGLWSFFRKRPRAAGTLKSSPEAGALEMREPPTTEQLMDLDEAWAELAAAQEASELTNFHACTRTGQPWTEDPAAVRAVAATLREFPAAEAQPPR
ncbi:hypothetical protein BJG92_03051 [Arthrobacter sp. SO5]|nr:hypothetical protein [Arthrobacter sp. SO5]